MFANFEFYSWETLVGAVLATLAIALGAILYFKYILPGLYRLKALFVTEKEVELVSDSVQVLPIELFDKNLAAGVPLPQDNRYVRKVEGVHSPGLISVVREGFVNLVSPKHAAPILSCEGIKLGHLNLIRAVQDKDNRTQAGMPARNFVVDACVPSYAQGSTKYPSGSGYDRGHLAARENCIRFGADCVTTSDYTSNVVPMKDELNKGPWSQLERDALTLLESGLPMRAKRDKKIWIYSGAIFPKGKKPKSLDDNANVPSEVFKLFVYKFQGALHVTAYVLPQDVKRSDDVAKFRTTLANVEKRIGLNLFPEATIMNLKVVDVPVETGGEVAEAKPRRTRRRKSKTT